MDPLHLPWDPGCLPNSGRSLFWAVFSVQERNSYPANNPAVGPDKSTCEGGMGGTRTPRGPCEGLMSGWAGLYHLARVNKIHQIFIKNQPFFAPDALANGRGLWIVPPGGFRPQKQPLCAALPQLRRWGEPGVAPQVCQRRAWRLLLVHVGRSEARKSECFDTHFQDPESVRVCVCVCV